MMGEEDACRRNPPAIWAAHPAAIVFIGARTYEFGAGVLGYAASAAVLATFLMQSMIRLRSIAILSNLLFVLYGYMEDIHPVMLLHIALLPINTARLLAVLNSTATRRALPRRGLAKPGLIKACLIKPCLIKPCLIKPCLSKTCLASG